MRQTKTVDDRLEPLSAAAIASQTIFVELFAEDAPPAGNRIAPEPTRHDRQVYSPTADGQVSGPTQISALNVGPVSRTRGSRARRERLLYMNS